MYYVLILELSLSSWNAAILQFEANGIFCPPKLISIIFMTAQTNNADCNPNLVSVNNSFHGTKVLLCQHLTDDHPGENSVK